MSRASNIQPLDYSAAMWTGGLWKERFDTCANSTVPHLRHMFESRDISHVLENFKICAGDAEGDFDGTVFGDGDFYKWMEAAVCTACSSDNQELLDKIEEYIDLIARAQQPDGYISTKQIIGERSGNGVSRMGDINDFEVYNFGHLFTTACVHKNLTGKDSLMAVAVKAAGYLERMYSEAAKTKQVQTAVCPSHYMGLMELYRTTGEEKYLKLAKLAIELRDSVENGLDDNQDRQKLSEHEKIIGHAVRANYLYAGVADICAEENSKYREMLDKVWRSLADKKLYITGGCGALYNGASPYGNFFHHQPVHQAYGYEYQLPNITAYNETCAAVGGVFWAWRMFRLEQKAEYFDVLERMMLNTNLAAFSLDGKKFFYENMLRREKKLDYELIWPLTRSEYILSYCCPPNLARIIAQSASYAYAVSEDALWTGLYGAGRGSYTLKNGAKFTVVQETRYPLDGDIAIHFENVSGNVPFALNIRVPAWAEKGSISVNGASKELLPENVGSYYTVELQNPAEDKIYIHFDMEVRYTISHHMVEENTNQAAVEYGPLVYCCESADIGDAVMEDFLLDLQAEYTPSDIEIEGRSVMALEGEAYCMERDDNKRDKLYQTLKHRELSRKKIRLIPYYAWDNREFGEMRIWFPVAYR